VRRELKVLSAAINHWHRESPLVAVPKVSLPEEGERRERVLERSEVARMLWACRKRKYGYVARFILIGVYTGTRHSAILSLRWMPSLASGHVDSEKGIIFRRGISERETSKRRPPVRVGLRLLAHLRRWEAADAQRGIAHVIHYQREAVKKIRKGWHTIRKDAGLGPEVTPHVMRHTAATWPLWAGQTTWDVSGIIGADASTVERVYGHHKIDAVTQSVTRRAGK
jgi:integrase